MHEIIRVGDLIVTLLKGGAETEGRFSLCELIIPAQQPCLIPHIHPDCDALILGVAGITTWIVGAKQTRLRPGERLLIPRGVLHSCTNPGFESARVACMYTPAAVSVEFFRELAIAGAAPEPDRLSQITAVMARAGMLPPPPA